MYRTPVYDAPPQEDAVMADGKFVEGMGIKFDIPEIEDRKNYIEEKLKESAPPYMPKLTEEEIKNLSTWITQKETEVKSVQKDPLYKFVVLVAGNLSVPVDKLFRFNMEHRHTEDRFFDVPGSDSQDDMILIKKRLTQSIADKEDELQTENIFQELIEFVNYISEERSLGIVNKDGNRNANAGTGLAADRDLTYFIDLLDKTEYTAILAQNAEGEDITQKKTKLDDLREYMGSVTLPVTYTTYNKTPKETKTVKSEAGGFENLTKKEVLYYLLFYLPPEKVFLQIPRYKTIEIYKLERELSALKDLYARTDIGAVRKRMAAALNWIERKEVLGMGDMSEELVMALDKATTLVIMNVPTMQNVKEEEAMELFSGGLTDRSNRFFTTLFADLVAKQINLVHFLEGIRGSFDRNHARIRLTIERILSAMKKFSYANGTLKIYRMTKTFPQMDRLDY